ncbi:MAG: YbhB/YbcL family Raf kinase inhibitor-like protein [Gemmatimonadetes bacterium]|nr:YbhB/YbcL family Raf kinase inhibitor-like protein [Gemmatimonadota bacterium]
MAPRTARDHGPRPVIERVPVVWLVAAAAAALALAAGGCHSPAAPDDDANASFTLTSSAFQDGGTLPVSYTCDGAGRTPPLTWQGAPRGTAQFALLMTTLAPDGLKWNWVLYGIPAGVSSLAENATGVGTAGVTSDGPLAAYSPPCSQGPGLKTYTFTIYALSAAPSLPAGQATAQTIADAIASLTLASARLSVGYTRQSTGSDAPAD